MANDLWDNPASEMGFGPIANRPREPSDRAQAPQVTEIYDDMKGFLKSTHWSKPYYSALVHNNPQLPYHLLEHVNCTYLSTPGRPPTLLALKQHAQSLAVLISLLAPSQYGGNLEPPNEEKTNGDAAFAAEQAFDWLNDLQTHYKTDDMAHKKPLNALANLIKSNSDTKGPKWHCPLDTTGMEYPEQHPFQHFRPYESHITLLMHANEILERLDHEYSPMGGILGIIPLDSDKVVEQEALSKAKTTLVGQWILFTQHLVVRMHELEIAYGNCLDLLANEAIVPMQHLSGHGSAGHTGREILFPQDRWILANAGEDVFAFIHQMLDRAEAHQEAQDDVFSEQKVLGDAAFSKNKDLKYRGIVKVDLSTRFYRIRKSGHGPLFVLPAFGDRPNTQHTRDMENRPTVVTIPHPATKETVNSWEATHKDDAVKVLNLTAQNSTLQGQISQYKTSLAMRDREIDRLNELQKHYDEAVNSADKDLLREIVRLKENIEYCYEQIVKSEAREKDLQAEIETFKQANVDSQNGRDPINPLVEKVAAREAQIRDLQREIKTRDKKLEDVTRDADTMRLFNSVSFNNSQTGNPEQLAELQAQLSLYAREKQSLLQEVHKLKQSKGVKGKILNLAEGTKFDYGDTFEDTSLGITVCSTALYKSLLESEEQKNSLQQKLDETVLHLNNIQAESNKVKIESERLKVDNQELRNKAHEAKPSKIINIPWKLQHTSSFRDDNQGLIVITTEWHDYLIATEKTVHSQMATIDNLQNEIKRLKTPLEVDSSPLLGAAREKLGSSKSYKDHERKVALLTLDYFDELQRAQESRAQSQSQLIESQQNVQVLKQELSATRTQLSQLLERQREDDTNLPDLQNQLDESMAQRRKLEEQIRNLRADTTSDPSGATKQLKLQLDSAVKNRQEIESELKELELRHEQLLLNERNLRVEVIKLRQQVQDAQKKSEGGINATSSNHEVQVYQEELSMFQMLYNDLQAQHMLLQQRNQNGCAEGCKDEKARLRQQLDELKVKAIAEPDKLQTAVAELEAQRDEQREHIAVLEQQLVKLKQDGETEKNELQEKIN
ncbi:hypothetical protein GGR50DRAFT_661127 [Xylaria sp. CBS 124048]|nr:hypothetical protein GGR50DRAFT_661127 [Xylaria sp. CBS 124048]